MRPNVLVVGMLLFAVLAACREQSPPPPAEPSERARAAQALLVKLEQDPASKPLRQDFLRQFRAIFHTDNVPWATLSLSSHKIYGAMLIQADRLARRGCTACLQAIMQASFGAFGHTSEGGEWIDEILWAILQDHTQLTLNALAKLPNPERRKLVDTVYTQPIHDDYNFAKINAALQQATIPPNLKHDISKIRAVVARE